MVIKNEAQLRSYIDGEIKNVKIVDMHTHLFDECFGKLFLYGIDEMLSYHYLISETFRLKPDMEFEYFNGLTQKERAEIIWNTLFVENTPLSEVTRSVITVFKTLGLDTTNKDINYYREYFAGLKLSDYVDKVFEAVGLEYVVMTNDPFDVTETAVWNDPALIATRDEKRFKAALRVDELLNQPEIAFGKLASWGVIDDADVTPPLSDAKAEAIRAFLGEWADRMNVLYSAVSLPPDFKMQDGSLRADLIEKCVIPVCLERKIPFGMMIGVRRQVNPLLSLAGDALGKMTLDGLEYVCKTYPKLKVLATVLSFEDQHGLAVLARKFKNMMVFGCWWFVNNPTLIDFITRMRVEMLGTSFIPQHSDCRVFEQLLSKWTHSKKIISKVLQDEYSALLETGYELTEEEVKRDIENYFGGTFKKFCEL